MKLFITLDTNDVKRYIAHLQKLDYKEMNNGIISLVRQTANDIKRIYQPITPTRTSGGKTGKYGAAPGNLRRSLRVFQKRQTDPFIVQFSVGFTFTNFNQREKGASDGYYAYMVDHGTAGRYPKKKARRPGINTGFIERARNEANKQIDKGLSEKGKTFIVRKLNKMIANGRG
jgi:hypothetical protein